MQVEKRVTALVEEKISDRPELFLVEVKMLPNNKLIIHVDGDEGISIQDCAAISRHVGFHLEEENTIEKAYNLEVSSPGVGEPLKLQRQYVKNIGRELSVKLNGGEIKEGKLLL
jgi:ribosome maturation factor RimP